MSEKFDVVVIGAGPGGYVAAIKSAKLGMKTAVIEEREVGGTCLNRGCIPAKAMIHASTLYREIKEADRFGISASDVTYDFEKILEYKEQTTGQLVQGVEQLLQANGVTRYYGKGTLFEGKKVKITGNEEQSVEAENVILASGSKPLILPIPGMDLPRVLTSDELFKLKEVPKSLVIIGGGVISVEFATVYSALGSKVTILEAMPRLVPNMDKEIAPPSASSRASPIPSLYVGCARIPFKSCATVILFAIAVTNSPIMSVALAHIICAPRITSVSSSATILINPLSSFVISDLPLALMINLPVFTLIPCSLAASSVIPADAISGSV